MAIKKKASSSRRSSAGVKKSLPKKTRVSQTPVVSYQRIIIFTACAVLALVAVVQFNKPAVTQSVAGVSVARGLFAQATVSLPVMEGAISYNIYYKKAGDSTYEHAVRNIPLNVATYTISYLTKGTEYEYKIAGVDANGTEFSFTPTQPLTDIQPM